MKKTLWMLAAVAGIAPGKAQTTRIDTAKVNNLQTVQVMSLRATQKTPMAFNNLSQVELREVNFGKDIPSILSMLPSVTTSSDAGTGIGYTGIHIRGTDPTRINVTTNGIPLNDAESSQLYWVNLGDIASSMQSVQVQRGVGTSTNGAGAFGATINMQTEGVGLKPYTEMDFSAGTYGTHRETLRFSTGLTSNNWGLQGRFSNIGSDGYIDRASTRLDSYFLQGGYFGDYTVVKLITFNGTERTYHAWDYASKADMQRYGRTYNPSGKYTDTQGNTVYYDDQTDNYHQQHYQLHWAQTISTDWHLNLALHYTRGDGYYEQYKSEQKLYKYLVPGGYKSDLVRQKKMLNDFYGTVASLSYTNHEGLTAHVGGGWNKYDGDHFGVLKWVGSMYYEDDNDNKVYESTGHVLEPNHEYYRNNAKKTDGNIYGKVNYELLPGFDGFLDLQYRHITYKMDGSSQEFDKQKQQRPLELDRIYDFFNPKFGLTYQLPSGHTLYASYAIAHKEPTRNDFEDMMAESNEVVPQRERLNDLEVGYRYESPRFSASANFYWMDYDNQFVLTGAQDTNGEMVARNIKESYRLGLELAATWKPINGLKWDINATFSTNRAKNMNVTVIDENWNEYTANVGNTHLAYSPDIVVANHLAYEWKNWKAALMTKYVSKQYMTNSGFRSYLEDDGTSTSAMLDAFCVSDFDLSYSFKLKGLKRATVGVTVYNVFNEEYETNGSCSMNFRQNNGRIEAFNGGWAWSTFSAQAPTHFLAHLSLSF